MNATSTDRTMTVTDDTNGTDLFSQSTVPPPAQLSGVERVFLLTDEQLKLSQTIQQPIKYCLVIIAMPLMIISVIVFAKKEMRSASGMYMIGLNVGQIIYVVCTFLYTVWDENAHQPYTYVWFCHYALYFCYYAGVQVGKSSSYSILCLATIERVYAVLRPLHVRNFVLSKRPLICIVIVYFLTAFWHLTYVTSVSVITVPVPPAQGGELCLIVPNDHYLKHESFFYGNNVAQMVVLNFISLFFQLSLNVVIAWALRRHNMANRHVKSSANEDEKKKQERQLTITLLGVSVSYVTLSIPAGFFNIFAYSFPEFSLFGKYGYMYRVALDFCYNSTVLGCGVDFVCYVALSTKYRKTVFQMFGIKGKQPGLLSSQNQTQTEDMSVTT